jgi:dGTPase
MENLSKTMVSDELSDAEIKEICDAVNSRNRGEKNDHPDAASIDDAIRREDEAERDTSIYSIVQNRFSEDKRRIEYAKAFDRMADKTQVITTPTSPHVSNRLSHTLKVASLSRAAARAVGLNEDLAESIALGHDLGHVPFGHEGEIHMAVSMMKTRADILGILGSFKHNVQSLNVVDRVETRVGFQKGRGLNLTDQVRHGILSHDGEKDVNYSAPDMELVKNPSELAADIKRYVREVIDNSTYSDEGDERSKAKEAFKNANKAKIKPGTLEAAVVAIVDVLAYAPQDFEDQIRLGVIKRNDLPFKIAKELGEDGSTMINRLISDLIIHSHSSIHGSEEPKICYSEKMAELLNDFKRNFLYLQYPKVNSLAAVFGSDRRVKNNTADVQGRFDYLFERFTDALKNPAGHSQSPIMQFMEDRNRYVYTRKMDEIYGELPDDDAYITATVMDYIAGFTDGYFFEISEDKYK